MDDDVLKQQLAELRRTVNNAAELAEQIPALVNRVTALERKFRVLAADAPHVDLSEWPELSDETRTLCRDFYDIALPKAGDTRQKLARALQAKALYDKQYSEAIKAARACTKPVNPLILKQHKKKWDTFVVTAQQRPHDQLRRAEEAHADYTRQRTELEDRAAQADEAMAEAKKIVRERLEAALDRDEVMPLWFEHALGRHAPAKDDGWLKTAIDLVVYRIAFGVTDRLYPFAGKPDAPAQKKEWERLKAECDKHKTA